jgi:hypothetical protein
MYARLIRSFGVLDFAMGSFPFPESRLRNGFAIGRRGQRAASQSEALLLLDPGIGRGLGEAGDGENDPGCSVKDRARDTLPRWLAAHDPR